MSYATQADMIEAFGETELVQLSDRARTGDVGAAVVAAKIADAAAEVDAYLQAKYTLPLQSVPPVLRRVTCDIARYHLYDDRATEQVTQRYRDAIRFLEALAKGTVALGPPTGGEAPAATAGLPQIATDGRTFTRDSLRDYGA